MMTANKHEDELARPSFIWTLEQMRYQWGLTRTKKFSKSGAVEHVALFSGT
jgi:hypothetical protein